MAMIKVAGMSLALAMLTACSAPTPWVKPYERANLADPVMNQNRDAVSASYTHHVFETRESSRGAGSVSGGGCGCN
jgi:Domain of unknown function (DUF4266)